MIEASLLSKVMDQVASHASDLADTLVTHLRKTFPGIHFSVCSDDDMPWEREGEDLDTKYMYVCHSELNAILNSPNHDLRGSRMYVTLFPCNECAKAIIQSGIKELIYLSDKYHDTHASIASRRMFNMTGVKYRAYQPTGREIKLDV